MEWFENKQNAVALEMADLFSKYRISEALMAVYKLFWDEFSAWYLEMIKPAYLKPISKVVMDKTIEFFDNLLHLLHPFMPFITEELWQHIVDRKDGESLMVSPMAPVGKVDETLLDRFEEMKEVISNVRAVRVQKNIAQKETLELQVVGANPVADFNAILYKMCNLSDIAVVDAKAEGAATFMVRTAEYAVPMKNLIDVEAEIARMEKELKAKYDELKDRFRIDYPERDIKYIDVAITASKADRDQINSELLDVAEQLQAEDADYANIVRKSGSTVAYSALPVRRAALPSDIATQVDSMAAGTQKGPFLTAADNTQNIVRLIAKSTLPDSVEVRQIGIGGIDEAAQKTADSIMTALNAGAPFDSIAKKYNQTGEAQWITSAQYENATLDENNLKFINAINTQAVGTTQQLKLGTGIAILRVTDRRNLVEKYQVAIVKRPLDFSNDTFNKTYNDFSQFVASNKTAEEIEANAMKAGYMVQQRRDISSAEHNIAGLSSTREAFRWVFNKDTKVGEVSEIYTCGNNDHLLVVILTAKNDGKFRSLESVKDYLEDEVIRDKKAALLLEKMGTCADIKAAAKLEGAKSDTIRHITFASPVFVPFVGGSEHALSGAVAKTAKGNFAKGVKGYNAVYAFQVLGESKTEAKLDEATQQNLKAQLASQDFRNAGRFMQELYNRAGVKDNRYLFY